MEEWVAMTCSEGRKTYSRKLIHAEDGLDQNLLLAVGEDAGGLAIVVASGRRHFGGCCQFWKIANVSIYRSSNAKQEEREAVPEDSEKKGNVAMLEGSKCVNLWKRKGGCGGEKLVAGRNQLGREVVWERGEPEEVSKHVFAN